MTLSCLDSRLLSGVCGGAPLRSTELFSIVLVGMCAISRLGE